MAAYLRTGILALFIGMFCLSGVGKLIDPRAAANALVMVFGFPSPAMQAFVIFFSNAELIVALLLATSRFRAAAMQATLALLAFFLVFLIYIQVTGLILSDCGCFGGLFSRTIPAAIFDKCLLIGLWFVYRLLPDASRTRPARLQVKDK